MRASRETFRRNFGACACLLATLLLYAPLAALAWDAVSMSCCSGDSCPIHHHHQKKPAAQADCDHERHAMSECSLRCCDTRETLALSAATFVLPHIELQADLAAVTRAVDHVQLAQLAAFRDPDSPPPRPATAAFL